MDWSLLIRRVVVSVDVAWWLVDEGEPVPFSMCKGELVTVSQPSSSILLWWEYSAELVSSVLHCFVHCLHIVQVPLQVGQTKRSAHWYLSCRRTLFLSASVGCTQVGQYNTFHGASPVRCRRWGSLFVTDLGLEGVLGICAMSALRFEGNGIRSGDQVFLWLWLLCATTIRATVLFQNHESLVESNTMHSTRDVCLIWSSRCLMC